MDKIPRITDSRAVKHLYHRPDVANSEIKHPPLPLGSSGHQSRHRNQHRVSDVDPINWLGVKHRTIKNHPCHPLGRALSIVSVSIGSPFNGRPRGTARAPITPRHTRAKIAPGHKYYPKSSLKIMQTQRMGMGRMQSILTKKLGCLLKVTWLFSFSKGGKYLEVRIFNFFIWFCFLVWFFYI